MKTFGFTTEEKILILDYLMSHRMKRKGEYSCTKWETVKKQRMRARKALKPYFNPKVTEESKSLSKLNFDSLTIAPRIGILETGEVYHIPVNSVDLNEEITNLMRRVIKQNAKYIW